MMRISGMFHVGIGDKFDESKGQAVAAGGFLQAPKGVQHFAWARRSFKSAALGPAVPLT